MSSYDEHISPRDLLQSGKAKNIKGFGRIITKACYHCKYESYRLAKGFVCVKHNLFLGDVGNTAEFGCDDFKSD